MTAMAGNLFDRLNAGRPQPIEITPPTNIKLLPIGRFLNWLLHYWSKPTISAWQIYTFGPVVVRNPKEAMRAAEILVQRGWLTPLRAHRHDRKVWLVNRDNKPTETPTHQTAEQPLGTAAQSRQ
jgi:hypothetical protein